MARRLLPPLVEMAPAMATLRSFYRFTPLAGAAPDVIVSAGGNTSFANALLARHFCVPNVFIGSRRRLAASAFAANLTLEPTGEAGNVVTSVAPSPISPEAIAQSAAEFRAEQGLADGKFWLMACGGTGRRQDVQRRRLEHACPLDECRRRSTRRALAAFHLAPHRRFRRGGAGNDSERRASRLRGVVESPPATHPRHAEWEWRSGCS